MPSLLPMPSVPKFGSDEIRARGDEVLDAQWWNERCESLFFFQADEPGKYIIRVGMGEFVDFFKPKPGVSICDMLSGEGLHLWSRSKYGPWSEPDYQPRDVNGNTYLGGSNLNGTWLQTQHNGGDDSRRSVSFWGHTERKGGCCSSHKSDASSEWGQSLTVTRMKYDGRVSTGTIVGITIGSLASCIVCTMTVRAIYIRRKARHNMFAYHVESVEGMDLAEKAGELRKLVTPIVYKDGTEQAIGACHKDPSLERLIPQNPDEDWSLPYYARNRYAVDILDFDRMEFEEALSEHDGSSVTQPSAPSEVRPKHVSKSDGGDQSSKPKREGSEVDAKGASASLISGSGGARKASASLSDSQRVSDPEQEDSSSRYNRSHGSRAEGEGDIEMSTLRSTVESLAAKVDSLSNDTPTPWRSASRRRGSMEGLPKPKVSRSRAQTRRKVETDLPHPSRADVDDSTNKSLDTVIKGDKNEDCPHKVDEDGSSEHVRLSAFGDRPQNFEEKGTKWLPNGEDNVDSDVDAVSILSDDSDDDEWLYTSSDDYDTLTDSASEGEVGEAPVHDEQHGVRAHPTDRDEAKKLFACEVCGKTFKRKYNFRVHERTHLTSDELPFECEICHERFAQRSNFKRHVLTNHEKPVKCLHCRKRFPNESDAVAHVREAHPDIGGGKVKHAIRKKRAKASRFSCACDKQFDDLAQLIAHSQGECSLASDGISPPTADSGAGVAKPQSQEQLTSSRFPNTSSSSRSRSPQIPTTALEIPTTACGIPSTASERSQSDSGDTGVGMPKSVSRSTHRLQKQQRQVSTSSTTNSFPSTASPPSTAPIDLFSPPSESPMLRAHATDPLENNFSSETHTDASQSSTVTSVFTKQRSLFGPELEGSSAEYVSHPLEDNSEMSGVGSRPLSRVSSFSQAQLPSLVKAPSIPSDETLFEADSPAAALSQIEGYVLGRPKSSSSRCGSPRDVDLTLFATPLDAAASSAGSSVPLTVPSSGNSTYPALSTMATSQPCSSSSFVQPSRLPSQSDPRYRSEGAPHGQLHRPAPAASLNQQASHSLSGVCGTRIAQELSTLSTFPGTQSLSILHPRETVAAYAPSPELGTPMTDEVGIPVTDPNASVGGLLPLNEKFGDLTLSAMGINSAASPASSGNRSTIQVPHLSTLGGASAHFLHQGLAAREPTTNQLSLPAVHQRTMSSSSVKPTNVSFHPTGSLQSSSASLVSMHDGQFPSIPPTQLRDVQLSSALISPPAAPRYIEVDLAGAENMLNAEGDSLTSSSSASDNSRLVFSPSEQLNVIPQPSSGVDTLNCPGTDNLHKIGTISNSMTTSLPAHPREAQTYAPPHSELTLSPSSSADPISLHDRSFNTDNSHQSSNQTSQHPAIGKLPTDFSDAMFNDTVDPLARV